MEHYLLIDGTGQLARTSLQFAEKVKRVSVIVPTVTALEATRAGAKKAGLSLSLFQADLTDHHALQAAIEMAISDNGPADVTVTTLGSTSPETAAVIAQTLRSLAVFTEYFDVWGAHDDPTMCSQREGRLRSFENVWYRKIVVGFLSDNGSTRWPSDEEISNGIIEAVASKPDKSLIGQTEPADRRPS